MGAGKFPGDGGDAKAVVTAPAEGAERPAHETDTSTAEQTEGDTSTTEPAGAGADADLPAPAGVTGPPTSRLAGANRDASAVQISRRTSADPAAADVVYLVREDIFADALTAGTLSDGPVPHTKGGCQPVPSIVLSEIRRVDPDRVIALGGPQAVCDASLEEAAQGRATDRIAGDTRQETAALIAERAFPSGASRVYVTRGDIGPDAVAGGSLRDGPTLLLSTTGTSVPAVTRAAITALAPDAVVALGGPVAVPDSVLRTAAAGRATDRLAGVNRYETAIAIARPACPSGMSPGDLVYRRGHVVPPTREADATAPVVLPDGTDLGVLLDGAGIGGIAPELTHDLLVDGLDQED